MKEYLFRVEGVNLNPTVYDTSDISTIRGGGFYLLSRVGALGRQYGDNLITEGASSAVFLIATEKPDKVRWEMLQFLYGENQDIGTPISEMMFLVEYLENKGAFPELMAKLMGKVRLSQMQTPSLRLFPNSLASGIDVDKQPMGFDELNRVLPAHGRDKTKEKNLSEFTLNRRAQGKDLRGRIYKELLSGEMEGIRDYEFTDSLEELSKDDKQGNLNGKIAYIYIDGNKFGRLQRNFTTNQLREYDMKLKGFKKKFLAAILELVRWNKSFRTHDNKVRLETLLWGGDELKLVVPACLGWKVSSQFYELAETLDMKIKTKIEGREKVCELTYAMGLVFAHHKNPIRNIDQIAVELAETVKKELPTHENIKHPAYNRKIGNRMYYAVLESLETLPSDYPTFAKSRYGTDIGHQALTLVDIKALGEFARLLGEHFSRSRIHSIAQFSSVDTSGEYRETLQRGFDICEATEKDKEKLIQAIEKMTGTAIVNGLVKEGSVSQIYRWRQVAELWDYLTWKEK